MKYVLFLYGLLTSAPVLAEGWYFDAGRGSASAEHSDFDLEGSDQYTRVAIGYERPDDISIEAGRLDLGDPADGLITASVDGVYGAIKGTLRGGQVDSFLRAGLFKWEGEVCFAGFVCETLDGSDLFIGAGFGFAVGPGSLNLELNYVDLDDEVSVTMSGISYSILFWR